VWQELRAVLRPKGLEIVTVALDSGGAIAARPWIEAAKADHPSLIDERHLCDELLGIVNVPSGVWIDETGTIVRPPEPAWPRRPAFADREPRPDDPPLRAESIRVVRGLRYEAERYVAALRDWVERGAGSRFALPGDEVVRRSRPIPPEVSSAAASFALGLALHRRGQSERAAYWFGEAMKLQPDNWTYRRQAWTLAGPDRERFYATDWLTEVKRLGAETYYPPLEL